MNMWVNAEILRQISANHQRNKANALLNGYSNSNDISSLGPGTTNQFIPLTSSISVIRR